MKFIVNPGEIEAWKLTEGGEIKIVANGPQMTAVMSQWEAGSKFQLHSHPHEQIAICLRGKAIFTIDGQDYKVKIGDIIHIPPSILHTQRNDGEEPAIFFECFAPPREDLLKMRFEQKIYSSQTNQGRDRD